LLFFFTAASLLTQEINAENGAEAPFGEEAADADTAQAAFIQNVPDDSSLYVIIDYKFSVKGLTLPFALLHKLVESKEYRKGETIAGTANLEKYLTVIAQIYRNERVLKDNVEVTYSTGDMNADGSFPVTIMIKVEDSFNIIALPYPYFKNNVVSVTLKARDYNFFGTMNALRVDLGYKYDEDERHSFQLGVFFDTPFSFLGYYWNLTFNNSANYRVGDPVYYENTTGLSMDLPFRSTTFHFGINERVYANQENSDSAKLQNPDTPYQVLYVSSNPYVSWSIPTGLIVSQFGNLTYSPSISATFNHEFPKWPLAFDRKGPFINFSHSLGFGKIDWHDNYREGLSFSLGNSYQYDFHRSIYDISVEFTGIGHHVFKKYFAVSARLMYKYWYSSDVTSEGGYVSSYMRGIKDDLRPAFQMLSLNLDLPVRLFAFTPSKWFNNTKLRLFDLEVHASPVIDLAVYRQRYFDGEKKMYRPAAYEVTGGLELVVFSSFMRSLYVRLGVTIDVKEFLKARPIRIPDGDHREIYFILGHFF